MSSRTTFAAGPSMDVINMSPEEVSVYSAQWEDDTGIKPGLQAPLKQPVSSYSSCFNATTRPT